MMDRLDSLARQALARWGRRCGVVLLCCTHRAAAEAPPLHAERPPSAEAPADPQRTVTLAELLAFAERHGPSARLARRRSAGGAAARAAASPVLRESPSLSLGAGPRFAGNQEPGLDLLASLEQQVEVAGERGLRRAAAARMGERLDAEVEVADARLRRDVAVAYHLAAVGRERWALQGQLARYTERALAVARRRSAAGDATGIEVRVAEADAARARAGELAAEQALWSLRIDLCLATGWPAATPPMIARGLEPPRPPPELERALHQASRAHPELEARRAASSEARAGVELADRRAWPAPTFGVQLAREGSVGSPANYILLGSVGLPLPLWSSNRGEREQSRVDEALAREEERLARAELEARVTRAHHEVRSAAARVELLGGTVAEALEDGLRLLERGFEHGESSLLDVSVARESLARAQLDVLEAYADYYRARHELDYWTESGRPSAAAAPEARR